jgi:hypothetical protein
MHGTRSTVAAGHAWWLNTMARMKPGTTLARASAEVAASGSSVLHETIPGAGWVANREKRHFQFTAEPGSRGLHRVRSARSGEYCL